MLLRCTHAFGNFEPGDEIEVPAGALYDGAHFKEVEPPEEAGEK
jgi:hypothetical protein